MKHAPTTTPDILRVETARCASDIAQRLAHFADSLNASTQDTAGTPAPSQVQRLTTDLRRLADLAEIAILGAIHTDPKQTQSPLDPYHLNANESEITRLFDRLANLDYIHYNPTALNSMLYVCTGRGDANTAKPLQWRGSARSLAWFISLFFEPSDGSQMWKKAAYNFTLADGTPPKPDTLRNSVNRVIRAEKGKGRDDRNNLNTIFADFTQWQSDPDSLANETALVRHTYRLIEMWESSCNCVHYPTTSDGSQW